jgi:hypothetical protein
MLFQVIAGRAEKAAVVITTNTKCRMRHLRHRFAAQTLLRWYRNGEDPKRRLPILYTYFGHAHVTDTYWYLTGHSRVVAGNW